MPREREFLVTLPPYVDFRSQRDIDSYTQRLYDVRVKLNEQRRAKAQADGEAHTG